MKRFAYVLLSLFTLFIFSTLSHAHAQVSTSTVYTEEAILSFVADITVNKDNSINVVDVIDYTTGNQNKHGIYRDIYPYSSDGVKMRITDIVVTDENKVAQPFEVLYVDQKIRIKIGNPVVTFSGRKIYWISYRVSHAIAKLKDKDEIYWNVTGNEWAMPIYQAFARVKLPDNVEPVATACYFGVGGSTSNCSKDPGNITTFMIASLRPHEGLTVAVGFAKGVVSTYSSVDLVSSFVYMYWQEIVTVIISIFIFVISFRYWYRNGRDPKGTGVIVPQYDVIDDLTPMEVAALIKDDVAVASISSEIIYLATKGYLKINQIEKKVLGIFKSIDYEIIQLKNNTDLPNDFDRKLLTGLFYSQSIIIQDTIAVSQLKKSFYLVSDSIISSTAKSLFEKGYYKNLGRMETVAGKSITSVIIFAGFIVSLLFAIVLQSLFIFLCVLSVSIFLAIFWYLSPAKTEKGIITKEYLLGLKRYLGMAEKRRLEFHNAPDKNPEVFEKLLPYAMALGVADIWAKEFEGIYTTPPSWYSGVYTDSFNMNSFSASLSHFNSFTSSSFSGGNSGGSGGSDGGGSSGGGGGGGGGGSW